MWRSLPEFSNKETSYEEWKKKVISLYPGASEEKRWSIADLNKVIGERARIGIHTIGDFGAYYRAFYTISAFLAQKNRLSPAEQSRLFIKGLSEELVRVSSYTHFLKKCKESTIRLCSLRKR